MKTEEVLKERAITHGSYLLNAQYSQILKQLFRDSPNWDSMPDHLHETLDYFAGKLSRVLTGNWEHTDNLLDIAGYATLSRNQMDKGVDV